MRAHKVKAVLAGKLKGALAHDALDAHRVDHHGAHDGISVGGVGECLSMRLEPLDAGLGVASQDDDVAFAECLVVELSGDGAHAGGRHDIVIGVPGQHADARLRIAAGKAAADEAKADDAGALGAALVNARVSHCTHGLLHGFLADDLADGSDAAHGVVELIGGEGLCAVGPGAAGLVVDLDL